MPHTRTPRGKSVVTKGVTTSKKPKRGLAAVLAARSSKKKAVPNRGSSRADAAKARAVAQGSSGPKQRGPKETPVSGASAGKRKPSLKSKKLGVQRFNDPRITKPAGKPKGKKPGFRRIKGAIITRRAGG